MTPKLISGERDRRPADMRIATVAALQHGLISTDQLQFIGVGPDAIAARVARGNLQRRHRGVFAVGRWEPRTDAFGMAAVLACDPRLWMPGRGRPLVGLSERWAAVQHGLWPVDQLPSDVDVLALGRNLHDQKGINLHRSRRVHPQDIVLVRGVPTTTVARTYLDLAEAIPRTGLARVIEEAQRRGLHDSDEVAGVIARATGRRGLRELLRALADVGDVACTRSAPEADLLRAIRAAGVSEPLVNATVGGYEADLYWPEHRLVVEIDSQGFHGTWAARLRDLRKSQDLGDLGLAVERVAATDVEHDVDRIVALIARRLGCQAAS